MSNEQTQINVTAKIKVQKYPEGTTQEQIDSGEVEPIETVDLDDNFEMERRVAEDLGLIDEGDDE
jgi:hypothetical protein